jgi:SAM-dependent methyltransferase
MTLITQYKELHKNKEFYEHSVLSLHKESIRQFLSNRGCTTILDYGCGKGNQYHVEKIHESTFYGIMPSLYDPAVEEYSNLPEGKFDAVISTDVLEHIEEQDLDSVFEEIYSKADKFVYLGICNSPANAILQDGRNAHVTQKPIDWWVEKIKPHANVFTLVFVYGDNGKSKAFLGN